MMCNIFSIPFNSILGSKLPSFLRRQESMFFSMDIMDPHLCWDDDMDGLLRHSVPRNDSHLEKSLGFLKISFVRFSRHFVAQNDKVLQNI